MSVQIIAKVWEMETSSPTEKLILLALAEHADDKGHCWPSITRLADKCSVCTRTVIRQLEALATRGLIKAEKENGKVNRYSIVTGDSKSLVTSDTSVTAPVTIDVTSDNESPVTQSHPTSDMSVMTPVTQLCHPNRKEPSKKEEEGSVAAGRSPSRSLPPEAELWNRDCGTLPKVATWNSSRQQYLVTRRKDAFWVSKLPEAVPRIAKSDFCNGHNERGWVATFDWLIERPSAMAKVIEGKFENRKNNSGAGKENPRNAGFAPNPTRNADIAATAKRRSSSQPL